MGKKHVTAVESAPIKTADAATESAPTPLTAVAPATPTPPAGAKTLSEADLVAEAINSQPDPNFEVIDSINSDGDSDADADTPSDPGLFGEMPHATGPADSAGEAFDPELHCSNEDGSPKTNKDGRYRRRKGYSEKVDARRSGGNGEAGGEDAYIATARITVVTMTSTATMMFGPAWIAGPVETDQMIAAWTGFYRAYGIITIPPWVMVLIVTGIYAAPRMHDAQTVERMAAMRAWMKEKFTRRPRGAYPDSRNDGKRKDNAGKDIGSGAGQETQTSGGT